MLYITRSMQVLCKAKYFSLTLLLKQQHLLPCQLPQDPKKPPASQEAVKPLVVIRIVFRPAQHALSSSIDFFVRHPWRLGRAGQIMDFLRPRLQRLGLRGREDVAENEVAVCGEEGVLRGADCVC
jgi:hypothetical protein